MWLAAQLGVHPSLISHWLAGRRTMSPEMKSKAAAALGVPGSLLFTSLKPVPKETDRVEQGLNGS